ncbi:MAG: hypothetical protein DRJ47_05775 [Thermoprotei archaeon]|nr:MAG: hypothetical protein DRJ47_05775 [Thermoprotei archaeon]
MSDIIYWQETKIKLKGLVILVFKRIFSVLFSPFTAFEDIKSIPETVGPMFLLLLLFTLQVVFLNFVSSKTVIEVYNYTGGNLTISPLVFDLKNSSLVVDYVGNTSTKPVAVLPYGSIFYKNADFFSALFLVSIIIYWFLLYVLTKITCKILKGNSQYFFSATGYFLTILLISSIFRASTTFIFLNNISGIRIRVPAMALYNPLFVDQLVIDSVNRCISFLFQLAQDATTWLQSFLTLWSFVMLIALFNSLGEMSLKRSIVASLIAGISFYMLYGALLNSVYSLIVVIFSGLG